MSRCSNLQHGLPVKVEFPNPELKAPTAGTLTAELDIPNGNTGFVQKVQITGEGAGKVLGVGKSGILYILDKDNMGKTDTAALPANWRGAPDCSTGKCFRVAENQYQPATVTQLACSLNGSDDSRTGFNNSNWNNVVDSYPHVHGAPVVWNVGNENLNLYVWPEQDFLKAYHFDGKAFSPIPVGSSAPLKAAEMSMPGGVLSLSWSGTDTKTGILWATRPDPDASQYAVATVFVSTFYDQQHFVFRDKYGNIWNSFYSQSDKGWHFQQINFNGIPGNGGAFVTVFDSADQQHFAYTDSAGNIWDSFYRRPDNTWHIQLINTNGHTLSGGIFVSGFADHQHFVWKDASGNIWDSFFRQSDNSWQFQQIHTNGHPAVGNVVVSVFNSADQQYFAYTDGAGNIWDSFYRQPDNSWHFRQITTNGHTPTDGIFVSVFQDQQPFVWKDASGSIWDSFFTQPDNGWHFQKIDNTFKCMDSMGPDLTPNIARCNAINKIVRGYSEAFDATPGLNG